MCENRMDLFIETLTGTAFELSCSPFETIVSIKAKIQYSEGIPVSQQHLIWKSQELKDDLCLQDYRITDGATLKLVLGMRGGPINTKQVSDTRKLKNIAEYVERNSEAGSSNGRPVTVLVFHDGDKVHMYTLMERGDCFVSPISGTLSETSSLNSIKNLEEVDRENEIIKEKIAQVQEQLKALNINKPKKCIPSSKSNSFKSKSESLHLPPIKRTETKQYSLRDAPTCLFPFLSQSTEQCNAEPLVIRNPYILSSPGSKSSSQLQNSSNFLPYLTSAQKSVSRDPDLLFKHDSSVVKKAHKKLPFSSNEAASSQKLLDLDVWLRNRPKTAPSEHRLKNSIRNLSPRRSLLMQVFDDNSRYLDTKIFKENSSAASQNVRKINFIPNPSNKLSRKLNEEISKPHSGKRLPVLKSNRKAQKRCTQCSRKTGLATSYTCRCGKNFCASHRYAELHHCTYDYKTEGRKILQLNNPVVTASKLPKI